MAASASSRRRRPYQRNPFNPERQRVAAALIAAGFTRAAAAAGAGVSVTTMSRALHEDEHFQELVATAEHELGEKALKEYVARAFDRDDAASARFLERLVKAYVPGMRDAELARVELTGPDGGPIEVENRGVSLVGVVELADRLGILDELGLARPGRELPAAAPVLPEPADS